MSLHKVLTEKFFFTLNVPSVFRFSNWHGRYEGRKFSRRISTLFLKKRQGISARLLEFDIVRLVEILQ